MTVSGGKARDQQRGKLLEQDGVAQGGVRIQFPGPPCGGLSEVSHSGTCPEFSGSSWGTALKAMVSLGGGAWLEEMSHW